MREFLKFWQKNFKGHRTIIMIDIYMVSVMVPHYQAEWGLNSVKYFIIYRDLVFINVPCDTKIGGKKLKELFNTR